MIIAFGGLHHKVFNPCWDYYLVHMLYPYNCLYPALPILVTTVSSPLADTPVTRTAAKSQEKLNYRHLTEIYSHYHGLSLIRTLTRGPWCVH